MGSLTVTIDSSAFPMDPLRHAARGLPIAFQACEVTAREQEGSSFQVAVGAEIVPEILVWGESRFGAGAVLAGAEESARLERILNVISSGAFPPPTKRSTLSAGQRAQLRDAMILEAHIRSGGDILVSDDRRAFVSHGRREHLETTFHTRIMTSEEFREHCRALRGRQTGAP